MPAPVPSSCLAAAAVAAEATAAAAAGVQTLTRFAGAVVDLLSDGHLADAALDPVLWTSLARLCARHATDGEHGNHGAPAPDLLHRSIRNGDTSKLVLPSSKSCACSSPIAHANLNPCPEHGLDTSTCGMPGRKSTTNCRSVVFV